MTVLSAFIAIVVMIIAVWVAIFGGVGALLSRSRGGSGISGFAWGTLLGPIGWIAIIWVTRGSAGHVGPAVAPGRESALPATDLWDD